MVTKLKPLLVHLKQKSSGKKYQTRILLFDLYTTTVDKSWCEIQNALKSVWIQKTLSDQYLTIKFQIKSSDFWFFKLEFKFRKQSVPDAHPDSWVINILKYFWNIQQLYQEVYLQFKGTWLFKCKQNGQILYFSSFWSSPYQMHNQIVEWSASWNISGIFLEYSVIVPRGKFTVYAECGN